MWTFICEFCIYQKEEKKRNKISLVFETIIWVCRVVQLRGKEKKVEKRKIFYIFFEQRNIKRKKSNFIKNQGKKSNRRTLSNYDVSNVKLNDASSSDAWSKSTCSQAARGEIVSDSLGSLAASSDTPT